MLPTQVPVKPELELQLPAADTPGPLPTRLKLPAKVMASPCDVPEPVSGMVDAPPKVTLPVPANGPVRCHTHSGQASHAVTTYRQCQRVLAKRLGVMPSEKTTRLYLAAIKGKTAGPLT